MIRQHTLHILLVAIAAFAAGAAEPLDLSKLPPAAARAVDYSASVKPIFEKTCVSCHGPKKSKGGLRLDSGTAALLGGDSGAAIVAGDSSRSPLIHRVAGLIKDGEMPPDEEATLSKEQIGLLRAWIDQGAKFPEEKSKPLHWSLQPLTKADPPPVKSPRYKNPIDAFVLAKLEEKKMKPAAPADKQTLLRRVSFDLTGLPPTPGEQRAFLADNSPDAYEKVVDRLLASPRYGERWARHWLDVVHYADTHGHDQDRPRPNAWPYRDYVIRAFNDDKPYARFIEEQLAGDVLYPNTVDGVVALGFIATGPWDESSQMHIMADTVDKKIAQNLDRDDMLTTTMQTFSSTTINCARCHNHKFDPISQKEYYALQACFAGMDRAERSYETDANVRTQRETLLKKQAALDRNEFDDALKNEIAAAQIAWEERTRTSTQWTVLDPETFTTAGESTLAKQADLSLLAGGKKPVHDCYTITAAADLANITAVRLEVLSDESHPKKGPGRQDNGNFALTEFHLKATAKNSSGAPEEISVQNPSADFNQDAWGIEKSLDGKNDTGWSIYPNVGRSHNAVFELKQPLNFDGGAKLTFVLDQQFRDSHLLGRVRLSVTTSPLPVRADELPEKVRNVLAVERGKRDAKQLKELADYYRTISPEIKKAKEEIKKQIATLPPAKMVYAGASDFPTVGKFSPAKTPRPIFMLKRGEVTMPLEPAVPGGLSCVQGLDYRFNLPDPKSEGTRRAALARWISDPKNMLTWRSIVNRAWHYHFGRGIVDTPNDFGIMGGAPSHPELLDWLANRFIADGGSFKKLDKLIVTSAAYRQSTQHNAEYAKVDSNNVLLWRMNRSRLDAESIRDAVLQITGKIDLTMGGPPVMQFDYNDPNPGVTPMVDYQKFDVNNPANFRLSIYRYLFRTLPDPFMDCLDCADGSQLTPVRSSSVTALQALTMLNNAFMVRQSEILAERIKSAGDLNAQIKMLYSLTLGREPKSAELTTLNAYAQKHGMANLCRLILNSNEFVFVN